MQRLFHHEFAQREHIGYHYVQSLNSVRRNAAIKACCRRIAVPCLETMSADLSSVKVDSSIEKPPSTNRERNMFGTPYHHHNRQGSLVELDLSRFRGHLGANLEPCSWLKDEGGLPYYLWSIKENQTIETSSLDMVPMYTAISHTWGRWQKPGEAVTVEGVHDWLVPENSIFNVKSLPAILREVPVTTPYIWFDLLCIPQDRSAIAVREIARQAVIFRGAQYAIAWLNMIPDWSGLEATTEWMCLEYLSFSDFRNATSSLKSLAAEKFSAASSSTHLFEPYKYGQDISRSDLRPSAWFTSLWTLQEACLRPDMLLCSKDWKVLTVGCGRPVPLDGLTALSEYVRDKVPILNSINPERAAFRQFESTLLNIPSSNKIGALVQGGHYPRGFIELFALLEQTGMDDLHMIDRESIMKLGSQRYCKEGRAEAIMSVIGATRWYIEAFQNGTLREVEKDLVLGLYPMSFLKETAPLLGARFYASIVIQNNIDEDISKSLNIRGSLLPFSTHSQEDGKICGEIFLERFYFELDERDHFSVKLWSIEADGSVRIPEAAVLAPASHHEETPLIARVTLAYPMADNLYQQEGAVWMDEAGRSRSIDLRKWEKNWWPFSRNYAVVLTTWNRLAHDYVRGILLKETGSGALVKVGIFLTRGFHQGEGLMTQIFPVRPTNWHVL